MRLGCKCEFVVKSLIKKHLLPEGGLGTPEKRARVRLGGKCEFVVKSLVKKHLLPAESLAQYIEFHVGRSPHAENTSQRRARRISGQRISVVMKCL